MTPASWQALLAPLPPDVLPRRVPVASAALLGGRFEEDGTFRETDLLRTLAAEAHRRDAPDG